MTTTTPFAPTPRAAVPDSGHVDLKDVITSEATKLRSVRSTWWTLASTIGIMVGFGALLPAAFVARFGHDGSIIGPDFDAAAHSLRGMYLAQLALGVLGVLAITNEYATGMIRNTFSAVPQRWSVLVAKLAVFGGVALVVGEASSFGAFAVGQAIFSQKHLGVGIGDPGVLRVVLGAGFYLTAIGLLGVGLGALLRRTAGAIAALVGIVLILPILASALPSPWGDDVVKFLPAGAADALTSVRHGSASLHPWGAFALMLVYVVVVLVAAFLAVERRDA